MCAESMEARVGALELRISRYKDGERTNERWGNCPLKDAQDNLCQLVRYGVVDRIEIRNSNDELIFHYPREP